MKIIKPEGLENLLIANWTQVLNVKSILEYIKDQTLNEIDGAINNVSVSRFEPQENGFILWIEFNSTKSLKKVYVTIESLLRLSGEIQFVKLDTFIELDHR